MKKLHLIVLGMLALVVLTAASCNGGNNTAQETNNQTATEEETTSEDNETTPPATTTAKTVTIEYTASGFSPANVTINKGDTVKFVNNSSSAFWPASGPHPVHTALPSFDAKKNIAAGGTYEYKFDKVGAWGYHNHLNSSQFGKVTVN